MALKKNSKNLIKVGGAAVVVVAIGVGAAIWNANKSGGEDAKAKSGLTIIKTYTRKDCDSTPIVVADAKGFYKKHGLQIEYTPNLRDTDKKLAALLAGTIDFFEANPSAGGNLVAGGAPIIAVSNVGTEPAADDTAHADFRHMRYFVNPNSGLKSFADLKNYKSGQPITVAGVAPSCYSFVGEAIFKKYGIDLSRFKLVHYNSDTEAIQATKQGNLDIADVHPPFYILGKESGLTSIGDSTDAGLGESTGLSYLWLSQDFVNKHPDTVQKLVEAETDAQEWGIENAKEAAELTAKATGQPTNGSHFYSASAKINDDYVQQRIDNLVADGFAKQGQLTVNKLITHKFDNYTADTKLP